MQMFDIARASEIQLAGQWRVPFPENRVVRSAVRGYMPSFIGEDLCVPLAPRTSGTRDSDLLLMELYGQTHVRNVQRKLCLT